jgi:hypothetical protein
MARWRALIQVRRRESSCLLLVRNAVASIRGPGHVAATRSAVTGRAWNLSTPLRGCRRKHSVRLRTKRGVVVYAGFTRFRYKQAMLHSGTDYIASVTNTTRLIRASFQILARSSWVALMCIPRIRKRARQITAPECRKAEAAWNEGHPDVGPNPVKSCVAFQT